MAETFLSPTIEKLVELMAEEVNLLKGVHNEVRSLKGELEILQFFLRDAEAKLEKGELNDAAKVWLRQLREDADRIEDIVDQYIYHVEQHRLQSGFTGFLRKASHSIKALKLRHDMAFEIQDIKKSLGETMKRGKYLGLRPFDPGSRHLATNVDATINFQMRFPSAEKEELVGIESTSKDLVRRLVEGPSTRSVISLVGEGGVGKTTLTKSVYDDEAVRGHFDFYAWITVSQTFDMHEILKTMKRLIFRTKEQAGVEIESLEELTNHVQQYLQTKRYVIVFDDVWKTNFWEAIKRALPNDDKGSRIIITTRYTTVADSFNETSCDHIEKLNSWSPELAWELFCKKAFRSEFERCCPKELEQLSRQIVDKCQGLPLVIAAVAGLLSRKKTKLEWRRVLDNLNYEFEENDKLATVSKVLLLSYHDLPYHLKPCLLYFGIFPEDYPIYDERLYRLWIAEGFIKSRGNMTFEQVAEEYLNQLIDRNLVSFEVRDREERYCRVHDLTHEMILKIAIELCFFQTSNTAESKFREKSRRIFSDATTRDILENAGHSRTRSVFLCDMDKLIPSFVVQLLKVLNF